MRLALLGLTDANVAAVAGVLAAGVGFAIPYSAMYSEAQLLFPGARVAAVGLFSLGANALPLVATPPVGAAVGHGDGDLAILALANLRPAATGRPR